MAVALIVFVVVWLLLGVLAMAEAENATHWIPWDAPKVLRLQRRAVCGTLTDNHSTEPTCRECLDYLARAAAETIESRYGSTGKN